MAYRLDLQLDPADAVRAVAAEQLADAITQLRENPDRVKAVHEARKDLKKVRSLLRLARPADRRETNARLRDVAAQLAGARDADVMVQTVEVLRERFAGRVPARAFTTVRNRFARQAQETEVAEGVVAELHDELAAVEQWRLGEVDLVAGIARRYARGRGEYRTVRKDPEVEALHEWRKRVKDLWYHSKLLEDAWPPVLGALAEEAHTLSDLLGDDHDLGVLAERIEGQSWPASVDAAAFVGFCHEHRAELQADAFALGRRLYAEKPKSFERRIAAYLVG